MNAEWATKQRERGIPCLLRWWPAFAGGQPSLQGAWRYSFNVFSPVCLKKETLLSSSEAGSREGGHGTVTYQPAQPARGP